MAVHDPLPRSIPFAVAALLMARVAMVLGRLRDVARPKGRRNQLHEMSDHQLADVGMERSAIHDAWFRRSAMEHPAYLPRNAPPRPQQPARLRRGP